MKENYTTKGTKAAQRRHKGETEPGIPLWLLCVFFVPFVVNAFEG